MGKALRKATKAEAKRQALNTLIDAGGDLGIQARKAKALLANRIIKPYGSPGNFHKPANAGNTSVLRGNASSVHVRSTI